MKSLLQWFPVLPLLVLFTQCETMDTSEPGDGGTIRVQGTVFYPDTKGTTYIVPAGAQVVGAGGTDCRYLVEQGGSLTAHSGNGNQYRIRSGGHFRGFAHPATNCVVGYEAGALIETEQAGPGTRFEAM